MAGKVLSSFTNGYAGEVTRSIDNVIETLVSGESSDPIPFGIPVVLVGGKVKKISTTDTQVIGVSVRSIKTSKTYPAGACQYEAGELVDVLKRGTIAMEVPSALTVAAGDPVYIVKATGALAKAADSTNNVQTNWVYKGPKDSNNIVEVALTERVF